MYNGFMRKHREIIYQYEAVFEPNGAGYTVTIPKLPGLITEGDNIKEAREMAKDAVKCYLEALLKDKAFISFGVTKRERVAVGV